jgi:hypothetical protein
MKLTKAFTSGLTGSLVLTATHQLLHKVLDDAPRMDLMGEEGLKKLADKAKVDIPSEIVYPITMAGDIVINGVYYAMASIGNPKRAIVRGGLLGLAAGIGAVCLPKYLGLTNAFSDRTVKTSVMTLAIYTLGGLVSGKLAASTGKLQKHR